jgi:hypothetical protein
MGVGSPPRFPELFGRNWGSSRQGGGGGGAWDCGKLSSFHSECVQKVFYICCVLLRKD